MLVSSLMLKTQWIWNRTGLSCASSPGLWVNLAIKHERVESFAGCWVFWCTIRVEKEEQDHRQREYRESNQSGCFCRCIVLIFPFLWGCIWHAKEQEEHHKQPVHSSVAGENQQSESCMQAVRTQCKPDSHVSSKAMGFRQEGKSKS